MSTSTRIFLTLTAVLLAVLVVYYGVLSDGTPATTRASESTEIDLPDASEPTRVNQPEPVVRLAPPPAVEPEPDPETEAETAPEPAGEDAPTVLEEHAPVTLDNGLDDGEDRGGGKDGPVPAAAPEESQDDAEDEESDAPIEDDTVPDTDPEPAPAPEPAERPAYTEYTVKANDTMSSIAQEWFGDASKWDLIAKANPLVDPARLQVGQVLRLPPKDAQRESADTSAVVYIVHSGDTLSKISRAYYGDERHWRLIYEANKPTIGIDPHNLKVGMRLTIPPAPSETSE